MTRQGSCLDPTPDALTVVDRLAGLSKVISPAVMEQALLDTGRAGQTVLSLNPSPPSSSRSGSMKPLLEIRLALQVRRCLQFLPQRHHDAAGCFYVLDEEPVREAVDPGGLQAHGSVERLRSLVGQNDKLRPAVMRVGLECDEPFLVQVVDDPLHVLAISAQIASEPRDRLWALGADDSAEDLPAGARQAEPRHQTVAGS